MPDFRIKYVDPVTDKEIEVIRNFETWTGRATLKKAEFGPILTITAAEWAEDFAYAAADKGGYTVEEIK